MRLRQLGTTQSVVFFAPPEVHQSILDLRKNGSQARINSSDVVHWLLEQTCNGIQQLQPLYFSQGVDFCRRIQAASSNVHFLGNKSNREAYLLAIRQVEQQTLEQLYGVDTDAKPATDFTVSSPELAEMLKELHTRRTGFQHTGLEVNESSLQEVEQEREQEVAHEGKFSFFS